MKFIVWSQEDQIPAHLIGGKALGLHSLKKIGFNVPLWATITTDFFREVIKDRSLLLPENAEEIRKVIETISFTEREEAILAQVWNLISENGSLSVAVRSSAIDEDGSKLSFAGQMDSFLHIRSFSLFTKTVLRCFASLYSDRAFSYRIQNKMDPKMAQTAVIVQQMVDAEVSGVVFTANPLNHNLDEMLVSSLYGLGDELVSGNSDADTYVLDRNGKILQSETVDPEKATLGLDQIQNLALLAKKAARAKGVPLDIEFSIAKNQIYFLQARPITSLKKRQVWDNSNIGESYSGVTTPLTFSFIKEAYFAVYWQFCETIGVSKETIFKNRHILQNMLGLIQGRVYYNLLNWYELVSLMPGFSYNKGFMEQMMGLQVVKESSSSSSSKNKYFVQLPRLLKISCKMLLAHFSLPKQIKKFHAHFDQVYAHYSKLDYPNMAPSEILAVYRALEEEVLWKWKSPITNDFEAMIFYGLLKKLTPSGVSQNDLLSGEGDITSTALISDLIVFAREISRDEPLKTALLKSSPEEAFSLLKSIPKLSLQLNQYLEKYGVRCINEMKLESTPIKDDPLFCIAVIQNYLRNGIPELKQTLRKSAEDDLHGKMKPVRRWIYCWLLRNARRAIKNRENQRFARTQAYSLVRTLIRGLAEQWHKKGIIEEARDIFFLRMDEVWSYIEGTSTCVNLKGLISLRKAEFDGYADENPDDRIETFDEVYFGNLFAKPVSKTEDGMIQGMGCCSGIVEGEVKVVLAPDSQLKLNKEIMVAKQTDPGWGVLFPSVSGLIIEKGSMLSHSAIVAREMGIPAVIGVKNATKIFANGDKVRLDGAKGTIQKI